MSRMTTHVGLLLYPGVTQLDLTAPYELFHRVPGMHVHVVWKTRDPVLAEGGLGLAATTTFETCPQLDVICVPGGRGQIELAGDGAVIGFLRDQARGARYVTAVCTGSLVLGVAGLLEGYAAATHWAYVDLLPMFGARPVHERVVVDRDRITAGGVTAGIDFGLRVVAELAGRAAAERVQLELEYDPAPPFRSGHPNVADPALVAAMRAEVAASLAERASRFTAARR
jgi:cyclohexyl-isocyanide hydratase